MGVLDIALLIILGISVISGMYKGFLSSALSIVGFAAAFFGAQHFYPQLASVILSNTSFTNVITYYLDASSLFKTVGLADVAANVANSSGGELLQKAVSELTALPLTMRNAFQSNVSNLRFDALGLKSLSEYLNQTVITSAVNVISFILLFVIAYIVMTLIINLLNNVFRFPLLKHFDWLLGGVFGLARGVVIAAMIVAVLPMVFSIINVDTANTLIAESQIAQMLPKDFAVGDIIMRAFR